MFVNALNIYKFHEDIEHHTEKNSVKDADYN